MEPWTPEKIAEFHAALAEYESEPDHAKRAEGAAPQLNSLGLAEDWSVTVEASGERVLCISNQHYAGMSDITPYEATIEGCARHLLSFIGARGQQAGDALDGARLALNVRHPDCHQAADAFWQYWKENGETHKRGYYESTWGAINRAIRMVGVVEHDYGGEAITDTLAERAAMAASAKQGGSEP